MTTELIAQAISIVTIVGWLIHLLYKHCYRKIAMRRMIWRYLQDSFMDGYDCMEGYRAMIRKTCMEDAKERFRKKN